MSLSDVIPLVIEVSPVDQSVAVESLRTGTRLEIPFSDLPLLKAAIANLDPAVFLLEKPCLDLDA